MWTVQMKKMPPNSTQYVDGSLLFWGCCLDGGSGSLMKTDGIINSDKYQEILEQNLFTSARSLAVDGALNKIMTPNVHPNHNRNV